MSRDLNRDVGTSGYVASLTGNILLLVAIIPALIITLVFGRYLLWAVRMSRRLGGEER